MNTLRRGGYALLLAGVLSMVAAAFGATVSSAEPSAPNAWVKEAHRYATNPGFSEG